MTKSTALEWGRIAWAEVPDANGFRKLRPVVIVTPTDQIHPGQPLDVIAITSRIVEPLPADQVLLPWHAQGHPRTGLNRKCAAVCSWICQLNAVDLQSVAGTVPGKIMLSILAKVSARPSPVSESEVPPADSPKPTAE